MKILKVEDMINGKVDGDSVPVSEAIKGAVAHSDYGEGQLEALQGSVDVLAKIAGALAECILRSGIMSDDELRDIVGYPYTVEWQDDAKLDEEPQPYMGDISKP